MPRQSALVGQIAPIIEGFILSKDDVHAIIQHISAVFSFVDLVVLFVLGWLLVPYAHIIRSFFKGATKKDNATTKRKMDGKEEDGGSFENSKTFFVVDHLSQIARLALLVYACDCVVSPADILFVLTIIYCTLFIDFMHIIPLATDVDERSLHLKLWVTKQNWPQRYLRNAYTQG